MSMEYEPLKRVKREILLDTDIGPDCDDAGALALLHHFSKKYGIRISGICNCTSNLYGCGAIDVIGRYCGADDIPIGMTDRKGFWDGPDTQHYNRLLSERFRTRYRPVGTHEPESAAKLYQKVLKAAEDKSVVFITIGMLNNVAELMDAAQELLEQKVYTFITMAGCERKAQKEFNVECDADAFRKFSEKIRVPIFYSPVETGACVLSGFDSEETSASEDHPIDLSYRQYLAAMRTEKTCMNASYDLTAVHFAFEGEGRYYKLSEPGRMTCRPVTNETVFCTGMGKDRCIELNCPEEELGGYFSKILKNP